MAAGTFGERNFGAAESGNALRTSRLVYLAGVILQHPQGTPPNKCARPADLKDFYRLMNRSEAAHDTHLAAPIAHTQQRVAGEAGVVLLVEDWTELDYTGLESLRDRLGISPNGTHKALLCASELATRVDDWQVLGLIGQCLAKRKRVMKNRTRQERRDDPDRGTRLWPKLSQHLPTRPATRPCQSRTAGRICWSSWIRWRSRSGPF